MSNALEILKIDNRVEKFLLQIRDEEIEFQLNNKSSTDRSTLFPEFREYRTNEKYVISTNVRKQNKDGVWYRVYHTKSAKMDQPDSTNYLLKKIMFDCYNFHCNGIVPFDFTMKFNNEPICIKCAYQWLSEEDRMAALSCFLSPSEYVINKYMKNKYGSTRNK